MHLVVANVTINSFRKCHFKWPCSLFHRAHIHTHSPSQFIFFSLLLFFSLALSFWHVTRARARQREREGARERERNCHPILCAMSRCLCSVHRAILHCPRCRRRTECAHFFAPDFFVICHDFFLRVTAKSVTANMQTTTQHWQRPDQQPPSLHQTRTKNR